MSNPFSNEPTIDDEEEVQDQTDKSWGDEVWRKDAFEPAEVKEDYETARQIKDEDEEADVEWGNTPVGIYGAVDQEKFWWVHTTLKDVTTTSVQEKRIPVVEDRFDSYEELLEARDEETKDIPDGIHLQLKESSVIRYVKGDDQKELLKRRGLE
jgi:hypothetical protein